MLSHIMKVWERVIDQRVQREVEISLEQFGFVSAKRTTDVIFAVRMTENKYLEGQK